MTTATADTKIGAPRDRGAVAGWVLSGLAIAALALDAGSKLIAPETMIAYTPKPLDLPASVGFYRGIAVILLASVVLYAWRRTALLGAILITGFLGGAVAVNARVGMPLVSNTLFGVYLGVIVWAGLFLRDARVRAAFG